MGPIYDTSYDKVLSPYLQHLIMALFTTLVTCLIYGTGYRPYLRQYLTASFSTLITSIILTWHVTVKISNSTRKRFGV